MMFTGIIVALGQVASKTPRGGDLEIGIGSAGLAAGRLAVGDSVSVDGVCLTVTRLGDSLFYADVSRETLAKTTLGELALGASVNLEPSVRAGDALGGHLVSGHVDALGTLAALDPDARSRRMRFELPAPLLRFVAAKGSIAVNGVSLTVNGVDARGFDVNIVPHTLDATTLGALTVGARVNIEIDLIARYLDRLIARPEQ